MCCSFVKVKMWPLLLDMTKEESLQSLRCLELEAYANLVTALRAQGPLNSEKIKILKETCSLLNITQDRHKAEVRRVVNDEKLNTIAYHVSGQRTTCDEWAIEGRRLCPLMPRIAPQTAFSAIADEVADSTSKINKQLPSPSSTERKRPPVSVAQCVMPENAGKAVFRVPEPPKGEESKKRKLPVGVENSSLAQHLMGSPKMSRIQQIYRQKTKARQKEQHLQMKMKDQQDLQGGPKQLQAFQSQQVSASKFSPKLTVAPSSNTKINILQNITVAPVVDADSLEQNKNEANGPHKSALGDKAILVQTTNSSDSPIVKTKPLLNTTKLSQHITLKHVPSSIPGTSGEITKTLKVCPTRKPITTKSVPTGQKLIVVSNPQTVTNPSILHRTLTIPFVKNLSMKNFDKFKIVNPTSSTIQLTPISNTITTNSTKHKVVTVRTNQAVKKVIPLSQLQVLNAKGSIKVLPIGGKIVTKSNANSTSAPIFIVNPANSMASLTKSTTSTPVVMSCKMEPEDGAKVVTENIESFALSVIPTKIEQEDCSNGSGNLLKGEDKSAVLAEIMEASGVVPADTETYTDFESQITQHTIHHFVENEEALCEENGNKINLDGSAVVEGGNIVLGNSDIILNAENIMESENALEGEHVLQHEEMLKNECELQVECELSTEKGGNTLQSANAENELPAENSLQAETSLHAVNVIQSVNAIQSVTAIQSVNALQNVNALQDENALNIETTLQDERELQEEQVEDALELRAETLNVSENESMQYDSNNEIGGEDVEMQDSLNENLHLGNDVSYEMTIAMQETDSTVQNRVDLKNKLSKAIGIRNSNINKSNSDKKSNLKGNDIRNSNVKHSNIKNSNVKTSNTRYSNIKNSSFKISTIENSNVKAGNIKNSNVRTGIFKSSTFKAGNIKNSNAKNIKNSNVKMSNVKTSNITTSNVTIGNITTSNVKFSAVNSTDQDGNVSHFKISNISYVKDSSEDLEKDITETSNTQNENNVQVCEEAQMNFDSQDESLELCQNEQVYCETENSSEEPLTGYELIDNTEDVNARMEEENCNEENSNEQIVYEEQQIVNNLNHEVEFNEQDGDNTVNLNALQSDGSTIFILDSDQSNDQVINSFQIQQPSDILNIVGAVSENNGKYIIENSEVECVQMETVQPESEYLEVQENYVTSDN